MQRIFAALLFLSLILSACSTGIASPQVFPTSSLESSPVPTGETALAPTQDCAYQWAYGSAPEAASTFDQAIRVLQPGAQVNVYTFGENCVRPNGSVVRFSAMETDFEVELQVNDLANEASLGKWIVKVLEIIENIPDDQIVTQRGRVKIVFTSGAQESFVMFYVSQYRTLPSGLSHAEIYQAVQALK